MRAGVMVEAGVRETGACWEVERKADRSVLNEDRKVDRRKGKLTRGRVVDRSRK